MPCMIRPKPKTEAMDFVTSLISIYYLLTVVTLSVGEECQTDSYCTCHTSKYKIDLNPLANGSNPRFSSAAGDYLFDYQPCVSLIETCPGPDVALCQIKEGEGTYDVGDANSAKFSGDACRCRYTEVNIYWCPRQDSNCEFTMCMCGRRVYCFGGKTTNSIYEVKLP